MKQQYYLHISSWWRDSLEYLLSKLQVSRSVLESTLGQWIVWLHLARWKKKLTETPLNNLQSIMWQFHVIFHRICRVIPFFIINPLKHDFSWIFIPSFTCEVTGLISCSPQCSGRCGSNCSTWAHRPRERNCGPTPPSVGPNQIQAAPSNGIFCLSRRGSMIRVVEMIPILPQPAVSVDQSMCCLLAAPEMWKSQAPNTHQYLYEQNDYICCKYENLICIGLIVNYIDIMLSEFHDGSTLLCWNLFAHWRTQKGIAVGLSGVRA